MPCRDYNFSVSEPPKLLGMMFSHPTNVITVLNDTSNTIVSLLTVLNGDGNMKEMSKYQIVTGKTVSQFIEPHLSNNNKHYSECCNNTRLNGEDVICIIASFLQSQDLYYMSTVFQFSEVSWRALILEKLNQMNKQHLISNIDQYCENLRVKDDFYRTVALFSGLDQIVQISKNLPDTENSRVTTLFISLDAAIDYKHIIVDYVHNINMDFSSLPFHVRLYASNMSGVIDQLILCDGNWCIPTGNKSDRILVQYLISYLPEIYEFIARVIPLAKQHLYDTEVRTKNFCHLCQSNPILKHNLVPDEVILFGLLLKNSSARSYLSNNFADIDFVRYFVNYKKGSEKMKELTSHLWSTLFNQVFIPETYQNRGEPQCTYYADTIYFDDLGDIVTMIENDPSKMSMEGITFENYELYVGHAMGRPLSKNLQQHQYKLSLLNFIHCTYMIQYSKYCWLKYQKNAGWRRCYISSDQQDNYNSIQHERKNEKKKYCIVN
jgi:hypothetical protein